MREMSTLCSAAILRTSGVDLVRRRCSAVCTPPPSPLLTGAGGSGLGARGVGAGFGAGFGSAAFGGSSLAGAGAAAPASVSRTPTTVCTGTVRPSWTLISANTPAAGAGISASTLSVEISNRGSSRLTGSPTFLSHLLKVPSAIDSPICGIKTSTRAIASPSVSRQPSRRLHDIVSLGQDEVLQSRRIRERDVVRGHAHDRPVAPFERLLVDPRCVLPAESPGPRVFMDDEHLVGLLHGCDDRGVIHRQQRPQVHYFHRYSVRFLQLLGRLQRFPQRRAVADDGKMLPFARDARLPDRRQNLFALRQLLLDTPVEPFVLEIEHGILVADRRLDETLGVPHRRRVDDLEAGRVEECRFR